MDEVSVDQTSRGPIHDWSEWEINLVRRPSPDRFFASADLDEVRQYMALCFRGERWCSGYIASEFERGVVQAAFVRLAELCPWSEATRTSPNSLSNRTASAETP